MIYEFSSTRALLAQKFNQNFIRVKNKKNIRLKRRQHKETLLATINGFDTSKKKITCEKIEVQFNKYETAPYFFLSNQNLTWDCLLIFVFLPEFD